MGAGQGSPSPGSGPPPLLPLQKIMHTRKRHQDMFQDLNRKLQHAAEKDKDAPMGPDSKVWRAGLRVGRGGGQGLRGGVWAGLWDSP